MPSRQEIATALFARCLEHDHKPGKVQFTKYLYLVDYCYWRLKGRLASDIPWMFYHFGPWSPAAEECMAALADDYGFSWREEESFVLRFASRLEEPVRLDLTLEAIIKRILSAFKDREPMVVVEYTYSQTEPMLNARRGEQLDFASVPVDQTMPEFVPARAKPAAAFALAPQVRARMDALKAKSAKLRQQAEERQRFRETPDYRTALDLLAAETSAGDSLPSLRGRMSREVIDDLGAANA
jgi:hypothetical protein